MTLLAMLAMSGCASTGTAYPLSLGDVDCDANELRITDAKKSTATAHEWVATCKGKRFVCSDRAAPTVTCKKVISQDLAIEKYEDRDDWW
jgi:hypothetical protein